MSVKFIPSFWMRNRHFQTLYSSLFRKNIPLKLQIQRFILKDADFIDAHWHYADSSHSSTSIVILFHGLTGSYKSPYIQGVMRELSHAGLHSVLMHFRGCSGEINKLPRSYHSGETGDALEFIHSVQTKYPQSKIYGVGYSLGGNMLLKLLGETKDKSPFKAAVSVSAPLELETCADAINKGFSLIYQKNLMRSLNKSLKQKYTQHDMKKLININVEEIKNLKTFWDFDNVYTAPIHGYKSAKDYYTQCSSKQYLKNIHTKTLIIHAKDDPFMNEKVLPHFNELSKNITLEVSAHGGHVGFIAGTMFHPNYWLEKRISQFITMIDK